MGAKPDRDQTIEQLLASVVRNHVIDRRDALAAGVTEDELDARVGNGLLVCDGNGSYRTFGSPRTGATAQRSALVAARGVGIGLWSALYACGITTGAPPPRVWVLVDWNRRVKGTAWYEPYRTRRLEDDELMLINQEPVSHVARSIRDLAAKLPHQGWADRQLIGWTEEGLISRKLTLEQLELQYQRENGRRVRARLRALLEHQNGDDLANFKSLAETWLRDLIKRHGLPEPEWNVKPPGFAKEVDAFWRLIGLVIEFDGFRYHHTRTKHDRDRSADRRHLRRNVRTVRITKTDFQHDLAQLESDIVFFVTGADTAALQS